MFKDEYLKKLMESAKLQSPVSEIAKSINTKGKYVEYAEWRMGTCAEIKIKMNASKGSKYAVSVKYDYKFECDCPTIERAAQMAGLFLQLIIKLDQQVGWPSNA